MKLIIGILLALNIVVFLLANFSSEDGQVNPKISDVPANAVGISLLDSNASPLPGNCANIGPIEQQIVLDQIEKVLAKQALSYRVLSEAARKVSAYRVVIPVNDSTNIDDLRQRLQNVGINESYEKTLDNNQQVLSLGVFTYKKTANDLAGNLNNTGFTAATEREFLTYPQRYWINLNQPLEQRIMTSLNRYAGTNKIQQSNAKCL